MRIRNMLWLAGAALLLASCKPTEKNYQAAYDAAQNKRKAEAVADRDMVLPAGSALQRLDAPLTKEVDGEQLPIKRFHIKYVGEGDPAILKRYNVAVARYKMLTNARAQVEDLVSSGYSAFPVEGIGNTYYVIAATLDNLEETAKFVKEYRKNHKPEQFVGLDGDVLIIER